MTISKTEFLNVDLDLRCEAGVARIVSAFGKAVVVLHQEETFACVELAFQPKSPEEAIIGFVELVKALSPATRAAWNQCGTKTLDLGIQSADIPRSVQYALSSEVLRAVADIGVALAVTVYTRHGRRRTRSGTPPR